MFCVAGLGVRSPIAPPRHVLHPVREGAIHLKNAERSGGDAQVATGVRSAPTGRLPPYWQSAPTPKPVQRRLLLSQVWPEQQGLPVVPQATHVKVVPTPPPAAAWQTSCAVEQVRAAAVIPVPQQGAFSTPQVWQMSPPKPVAHWRPPAVQTGLLPRPLLSQHGSPSAPQVPPADTQALPEQVPPPRVAGQGLPWPMQFPTRLQQPPLEQELSGQQAPPACPQLVHVPSPMLDIVQVVPGALHTFPGQQDWPVWPQVALRSAARSGKDVSARTSGDGGGASTPPSSTAVVPPAWGGGSAGCDRGSAGGCHGTARGNFGPTGRGHAAAGRDRCPARRCGATGRGCVSTGLDR